MRSRPIQKIPKKQDKQKEGCVPEDTQGCVPEDTHPQLLSSIFVGSRLHIDSAPHFGIRPKRRSVISLKSICTIFILVQVHMHDPRRKASRIMEKIVEDGLHPHPGPKAGSRRRRMTKSKPEDDEWKKKLKRRVAVKKSAEEHFHHCMALLENDPGSVEDVVADKEGTAPSIAIVLRIPPAKGKDPSTTPPTPTGRTDETDE